MRKQAAGKPGSPVACAIRDRVAWVTLDTRACRGRIAAGAAQALCDVATDLATEERVALVVIGSTGPDFCLGFVPGDWHERIDCIAALAGLPQPLVARVQGRAAAEGCELALACDLRIAAAAARFSLPQVRSGRLPRHGGTQRLPRLVGTARALEIIWSGRAVGAAEAETIGLVTRVVPGRGLDRAAEKMAAELRRKGALGLRLAKEAVRGGMDMTLDQGIRLEQDLYALLQTTRDRAEGIGAFLEKRPPRFTGT